MAVVLDFQTEDRDGEDERNEIGGDDGPRAGVDAVDQPERYPCREEEKGREGDFPGRTEAQDTGELGNESGGGAEGGRESGALDP